MCSVKGCNEYRSIPLGYCIESSPCTQQGHTVLKFCSQFVLQNVLIISWFPANFCHAEHVNGYFKRKNRLNINFPPRKYHVFLVFFSRNKFSHVPFSAYHLKKSAEPSEKSVLGLVKKHLSHGQNQHFCECSCFAAAHGKALGSQ